MRVLVTAALAMLCLTVVGCDKGLVDPSQNVNDTFTGTINPFQAGGGIHTLNITRNGEYFITFTSLTPPLANLTIPTDIRLTAAVSGSCVFASQIVGDNPASIAGKQVLNGVISPGTFCLWIVDEGYYLVPETYVVTVNHP